MKIGNLEIEANAGGFGRVKLDGEDISDKVGGVNIRIRPGELTKVYLFMAADLAIHAEGEIITVPFDGIVRKTKAP